MGIVKGGFQRLLQTILYGLCFCCAGIILGVYSYFLSVLADRDDPIANWKKAVEGISGAAVLYTIFAIVLTCCLGGISFFAFLALVLDILFAAGMIAIAVMARDGAGSCSGNVQTPIGNGDSRQEGSGFGGNGIGTDAGENLTYASSLHTACRLNTAAFAVAIVGAFLFFVTAAMQVLLVRHHKKEKRYGPSPSNNYTSGYGKKKRFGFGRKNKNANTANQAEMGAVGRPSHETGMTGTTVGNNGVGATSYDKVDGTMPTNGATNAGTYGSHAPHGAHG